MTPFLIMERLRRVLLDTGVGLGGAVSGIELGGGRGWVLFLLGVLVLLLRVFQEATELLGDVDTFLSDHNDTD